MTLRSLLRGGRLPLLAVALSFPAIDVALAQVEEIVVSARKRDERLVDVPIAITAFDSQLIDQEGISDVADVANLTPGLQFDRGITPGDLRPSLRGIPLIEGRSNVALLVDGIDITGLTVDDSFGGAGSQLEVALLDLERVEVIKGPQSVYFGRSAFSGAIQFVTRDPDDEFEGKVNAGLGDHGYAEISGHVGGPLIEGLLNAKVSAVYRNFDGFYKNAGNNAELGSEKTLGAAGTAVLMPTEGLTITGRVTYMDKDVGHPPGYIAIRQSATSFEGSETFGEDDFDEDQIALSTDMEFEASTVEILRTSLEVEWELGDFLLSSLTGLNVNDGVNEFDFDRVPANAVDVVTFPGPAGTRNCIPGICHGIWDYDFNLDQFSQEVRLAYEPDGPFNAMVGAYLFDEDYEQIEYNRFVDNPSVGIITTERTGIAPRDYDYQTEAWSVFGSASYDFTPEMTLTGEIRYNREEISAAAPVFTDLLQLGNPAQTFFADTTFHSVNPRLALDYAVSEDGLVYASVARGSKPGGINLGQVVDQLRFYDEESIWTYELGTKLTLMEGRVLLNAAAYYSDYENVQITNTCFGSSSPFGPEPECPTSAASNLSYIDNGEEAEIFGFEIDVSVNLAEGLDAFVSYAYTNSEFTKLDVRDPLFGSVTGAVTDYSGNKLPLIPEHAATARLRYQTAVNDAFDWFGEVGGRYSGEKFARFTNRVKIEDKTVVNLRAGLEGDSWSALVFVDNVFEDLTPDYTRSSPDFNPFNIFGEHIAAPDGRQIGARFSYSF